VGSGSRAARQPSTDDNSVDGAASLWDKHSYLCATRPTRHPVGVWLCGAEDQSRTGQSSKVKAARSSACRRAGFATIRCASRKNKFLVTTILVRARRAFRETWSKITSCGRRRGEFIVRICCDIMTMPGDCCQDRDARPLQSVHDNSNHTEEGRRVSTDRELQSDCYEQFAVGPRRECEGGVPLAIYALRHAGLVRCSDSLHPAPSHSRVPHRQTLIRDTPLAYFTSFIS